MLLLLLGPFVKQVAVVAKGTQLCSIALAARHVARLGLFHYCYSSDVLDPSSAHDATCKPTMQH
jgi:hypothetical protein